MFGYVKYFAFLYIIARVKKIAERVKEWERKGVYVYVSD